MKSMKKKKKSTLVTFSILIVFVLLLGCLGQRNQTAIGSPGGSVPFGTKAYSPDGKMYVREIEPQGYGHIGVFDVYTNNLLWEIKVIQHPSGEYWNDLKGFAWSPDSRWIAVMYHHGGGGHISIIEVDTGIEIKYIPISEWYHRIQFSSDGTKIIADGDTLEIL